MFVENHLFRKVDNRRIDTSMQTCCRDQRKVGEVIDQIQTLADNLDELYAAISALKNNLAKDRNPLSKHCCGEAKSTKTSILNKVKKYMRKMKSIDFFKNGGSCTNYQKVHYSRTDPPVVSLFSNNFPFGKSENMSQIPTKVKYLKDEDSQTENSQQHIFALSVVESPVALRYMGNILQSKKSPSERGSNQYDKIIIPTKGATFLPPSSEISCKLSFRVEDPSDFKDIPKNMEVGSLKDKQFASASTQTKMAKAKRKRGSHDFHSKHPHVYFSRIKDAVIMKKIIRNSNDSKFEKGKRQKDYPYLKKRIYKEYSANGKGRNGVVETVGHEISEEKYFYDEDIRRLKRIPSVNDSDMYQNFSSEEEMKASSSTSVSLNLELHVSNSSNQTEDFLLSRKPRTYTINKRTQKCNQNGWLDQVERSIVYVESTSHLNLSSQSFSN